MRTTKYLFSFLLLALLFSCVSQTTKTGEETTVKPRPSIQILTTAYVLKDNVNLRKGPGTHYAAIGKLMDGDEVRILKNQNGWYQILTDQNKTGWVRSNLIGPRNLSRSRMASAFNDTVMQAFDAKLYIDKNKPYKVIYIEAKEANVKKAKQLARKIGKAFQQKVYPGKLTINLIRPGKNKYFAQIVLPAMGIADVPVPVVLHGYVKRLKVKDTHVKVVVVVSKKLKKATLLKLARKISATYSYPFTKSEVVIRNKLSQPGQSPCLLYYVEDEYGENYAFNKCKM